MITNQANEPPGNRSPGTSSRGACALKPKRKIIISLHGIRTRGVWQKQIASVISENGWIYYPLDYGYFPAIHFAVPGIRKAKITWFCNEFDQIKERYPNIIPSVVAHSNGTYIVANALKTYPHIKVDKLIVCGSIVDRHFDWETIFKRKQATLVRNEVGVRDIWAGHVQYLAWGDTGASGQRGFIKGHPRLSQPVFPEFGHSTSQAYGHYRAFWLPFFDEPMPYEGEEEPPWYNEEPVSPYDAARWSAMTYYYQYVARIHQAIVNREAFSGNGEETVLPAKCLWIVVPRTPGGAAKDAITLFFRNHGLKPGQTGKKDPRGFQYSGGEILYDIPSTLNTLRFLENRSDEEMNGAVVEFQKLLQRLIEGSRSDCAATVQVKNMDELPPMLR